MQNELSDLKEEFVYFKNETTGIIIIIDTITDEFIKQNKIKLVHSRKYARIKYENSNEQNLSEFVILNIKKQTYDKNTHCIDHVNGNKYDNTKKNLRILTYAENALNKTKRVNVSSRFFGVSKVNKNKWRARIQTKNLYFCRSYNDEIHAAYHYNLAVLENDLQHVLKLNNIEKPIDFILNERYPVKRKFIHRNISIRKKIRIDWFENNPQPVNSLYNIPLFNLKRELVGKCIVDYNVWEEYKMYSFYLNGDGYATFSELISRQPILLHRKLMSCKEKNKYVNHKNGNRLDCRLCNLEIVTPSQNAQNIIKKINTSSQYKGVIFTKSSQMFTSLIIYNYKRIYLGSFKTEKEAALAYNKEAERLNKEHDCRYNLNIIQN